MKLPWKTKGICLTAPFTKDVDDTVRFIDEYLAPNGCNLIVLQIRYRYQFKRHPECQGYDPLSEADIKKLVAVCRKNGIRLIPKINILSHQSGLPNNPDDSILHGHDPAKEIPDIKDALLRAYPEFDEQPNERCVPYTRSLCLTNPLIKIILFDMIDELLEVFEADGMHIGCDEMFNVGCCDECKKHKSSDLFADWVNSFNEYLASKGIEMFIWGDRLLSQAETGYNDYESSPIETHNAIEKLSKDIVICDWHYGLRDAYPSVDIFAKNGFKMLLSLSPHGADKSEKFIEYGLSHDEGHIDGVLVTTWFGAGELARYILDGKKEKNAWFNLENVSDTVRLVFEQ